MSPYQQCKFGGYCRRLKGHVGIHTSCPNPRTWDFDMKQMEKAILESLDFETPWYADLRDD